MLYVKYLGKGKGPILRSPTLSRQYDFTSGAAVMVDQDARLLVTRCRMNYKIEENPNSTQRAMIAAAEKPVRAKTKVATV